MRRGGAGNCAISRVLAEEGFVKPQRGIVALRAENLSSDNEDTSDDDSTYKESTGDARQNLSLPPKRRIVKGCRVIVASLNEEDSVFEYGVCTEHPKGGKCLVRIDGEINAEKIAISRLQVALEESESDGSSRYVVETTVEYSRILRGVRVCLAFKKDGSAEFKLKFGVCVASCRGGYRIILLDGEIEPMTVRVSRLKLISNLAVKRRADSAKRFEELPSANAACTDGIIDAPVQGSGTPRHFRSHKTNQSNELFAVGARVEGLLRNKTIEETSEESFVGRLLSITEGDKCHVKLDDSLEIVPVMLSKLQLLPKRGKSQHKQIDKTRFANFIVGARVGGTRSVTTKRKVPVRKFTGTIIKIKSPNGWRLVRVDDCDEVVPMRPCALRLISDSAMTCAEEPDKPSPDGFTVGARVEVSFYENKSEQDREFVGTIFSIVDGGCRDIQLDNSAEIMRVRTSSLQLVSKSALCHPNESRYTKFPDFVVGARVKGLRPANKKSAVERKVFGTVTISTDKRGFCHVQIDENAEIVRVSAFMLRLISEHALSRAEECEVVEDGCKISRPENATPGVLYSMSGDDGEELFIEAFKDSPTKRASQREMPEIGGKDSVANNANMGGMRRSLAEDPVELAVTRRKELLTRNDNAKAESVRIREAEDKFFAVPQDKVFAFERPKNVQLLTAKIPLQVGSQVSTREKTTGVVLGRAQLSNYYYVMLDGDVEAKLFRGDELHGVIPHTKKCGKNGRAEIVEVNSTNVEKTMDLRRACDEIVEMLLL